MIRPDKEVKKEFKGKASAHPDKYYATAVLKREGFERKHCTNCGMFFWTVNSQQQVCGDPSCSGGFRFFDHNPAKHKMTYTEIWHKFSQMMEARGYRVMQRYPVVARWNPTTDFTIASIAAFQPHVVNGEVDPPARKLVIPQFCLRFGDIDNVGITGSHNTGFVMIGQHMFVPPEQWDQNQAFQDLYDWFTQGLGLPKDELTFHEDAWAGGGNFGPCMEFFSRGVELANQVYMLYEQGDDGDRELSIKVLDMGMGMERNAWFSQGKGTMYDAAFPQVISHILERTGHTPDYELQRKFLPLASYLNIDEVDDITAAWERVGKAVGVPAMQLREAIEPMQAIYSIAEHSRSLLFALTDGGLPSNVGGGYNLRTIYRRAQGFIEKHNWNLDLAEVAQWHAIELQHLFPELLSEIENTKRILAVEKEKHQQNKLRAASIIAQELKKAASEGATEIAIERLIALYDSSGIHPEVFAREARKQGVRADVPDNFFQLVAQRHEHQEQSTATKRKTHFALDNVPRTQLLYLTDYSTISFEGQVVHVIDPTHIVLDKTAFYPTSGGQEHDTGRITTKDGTSLRIIDVIKQGGVVIHVLEEDSDLAIGDCVTGEVDWERRRQLAQHHTATHIINGAARKVLGNHIWQAGAAKTQDKARIDITHYAPITDEQLSLIEHEANTVVNASIAMNHTLMPKHDAEAKYGFRLYQGGAVPGKEIRVVNIPGFDVEACGGTHLNNTSEAGTIKLLKASKIQDGIIRLEYVAGDQASKMIAQRENMIHELCALLEVDESQIPAALEALFANWKKARKGQRDFADAKLVSFSGDVLAKASEILSTPQNNLIATVKRFKKDIEAIP